MEFAGYHPMLRGWIGATVWMSALWTFQAWFRDAGIVDVGWAAATGGLGVYYAFTGSGLVERRYAVGLAAGIWGLRLAVYLLLDRVWGRTEDRRYQTLRAKWGTSAPWKFFLFFQAQGVLAVLLSAPMYMACQARNAPALSDVAAVLLWGIGIAGEALADRQLVQFKQSPASRGRTCRAGLWRYSRHPNYFFEWVIWCAYGLAGCAAEGGWVGLASPMVMLFLILKVTGIPPAEAQALKSRGDDYRDYQRTTSAFVPWRVKR